MMDQTVKKDWVKALRSGEYKQTHGCLYRQEAYCCLGVLSAVLGEPIRLMINQTGLSGQTRKLSGFRTADPLVVTVLDGDTHFSSIELSTLNDVYKWDFNKIADAIENDDEL